MKATLFWMVFILENFNSTGQSSFLVVQLSGSGNYTRSDQKIPLKIGTSLTPDDEVTLRVGAGITLVCNNYATFTLQAGKTLRTIPLKRFTDSCRDKRNSTTAGYIKYIWQELTTPKAEASADNIEQSSVAGAISREIKVIAISGFESIPGLIKFYKRDFAIQWTVLDTSIRLALALFSVADSVKPFLEVQVKDKFRLAELKKKLPPGMERVYWTILIDGKELLNRKTIEFLKEPPPKPHFGPNPQYQELSLAEKDFLIGYFLGLNHAYGESYHYYVLVHKLSPNNTFFQTSKAALEKEFNFNLY